MLVFVFLVGILFGYLICEEVQKSSDDVQADRTEYIDFVELQEIVRRMDETSRKLQVIDRLLLDMELSDDDGEQAVKIVWDDAVKENSYSFGCQNSDFAEIAQREKVKLRNALLDDLREIGSCPLKNSRLCTLHNQFSKNAVFVPKLSTFWETSALFSS